MMLTQQLLTIFFIAWTLTKFEPIKLILEALKPTKTNNKLSIVTTMIIDILLLITTCLFCANFWIGLILTHDLLTACIASYLGFWYNKFLLNKETEIRF